MTDKTLDVLADNMLTSNDGMMCVVAARWSRRKMVAVDVRQRLAVRPGDEVFAIKHIPTGTFFYSAYASAGDAAQVMGKLDGTLDTAFGPVVVNNFKAHPSYVRTPLPR